jgi:hypothetical protein
MRNMASGMLALALVFGTNAALAQQFGAKGTPVISADRLIGLSFNHSKYERNAPQDDLEVDTTHFGFLWPGAADPGSALVYDVPRLAFDYFIIDRLSIGGAFGYASFSSSTDDGDGDVDVNMLIFAPRVGYVWNLNNWASFWLRGGFTYNTVGGDAAEENALAFTAEPTFLLSWADRWGFTLGPTVDITLTGSRDVGTTDQDLAYRSLALVRAGLVVWF